MCHFSDLVYGVYCVSCFSEAVALLGCLSSRYIAERISSNTFIRRVQQIDRPVGVAWRLRALRKESSLLPAFCDKSVTLTRVVDLQEQVSSQLNNSI